ncbi:sensor histidine kinase [Fictibacillus sp. BK138]|uniref:sensor histidine kinase n=1 Tax=Fictibacillus sp. BK138 TaxID=2512121 RepID=UPI001028AD50|nr:HAMP domain-containing sensor histidine kinase [Fictibacillus sp. BK138]RZT21655.1 signal transduction histidine kinase [Fictibacillus sp. BK138]
MKTLYLRIVLTTILVMLISSVIAFILANAYYQFYLKPANDEKITAMANQIQMFNKRTNDVEFNRYLNSLGNLGYQLFLASENKNGTFYGEEFREKKLETSVVHGVVAGNNYHGIKDFPAKLFITGFFDNDIRNTIGVPVKYQGETQALFIRPNLEVQFGEMRIFFALLLAFTLILSILFVFISTRYIVKPIVTLTEATKTISKGNYKIDLNVNRQDEIGELAGHFAYMAKNLEQLEEMRQEFVSNVSHEIQSPLASIQGFSKTLQSDHITEQQRNQYLSIIESESKRISALSKQLLTLASLDKEEGILEKSTYDLGEQIKQVLFMTEYSWREKDIAVEMDLPSVYIHADQKLLHQVWSNLITNAVKYTPAGGTLSLHLTSENDRCYIKVQDTGIGISKNDLPHIFNRFYKADKVRNRKEGNSGLGLAITKKIIELHEGDIYAKSELNKGTTFYVEFPRL